MYSVEASVSACVWVCVCTEFLSGWIFDREKKYSIITNTNAY